MSEDSIARGRAEARAPLPPHKRLLAGLKNNGWSPSSSPSCAGPLESTRTKGSFIARLEDNLESASMVSPSSSPSCAGLESTHTKGSSISRLEDNLESACMVEVRKDANTGSMVKLEDSIESTSTAKVEERGQDKLNAGSMAKLDSSLDSPSLVKLEEHNDGSVEHGDRECANFASESMDLYHLRLRKSKRLRAVPVDLTWKAKKKVSKAVSADHFRRQKSEPVRVFPGVVIQRTKRMFDSAEKNLQSEGSTMDKDVSAMVATVSVDTNVMATIPTELAERDTANEVKEGVTVPAAVRTIDEESGKDTVAACAGDPKPGLSISSKAKGGDSVCGEVSRNHKSKAKEEDGKRRRNPSRKYHDRIKETDQNRQEVQTGRRSMTPPSLSDEEVALQLCRLVNSCQAKEVKEGGTVPAAVRTNDEESGEDPKPGLSTCSNGDESVCSEVSRNHRSKAKEEDGKPRRNPSRTHQDRIKESGQNRQEVLTGSSRTPPPLSDEELALQLHRIMNSSPRISRRLNYKEDGPLLYPRRK